MSSAVFYIENMNLGSTVAWKISIEACDRRSEVHIFLIEHNIGDMNFFLHPFKCIVYLKTFIANRLVYFSIGTASLFVDIYKLHCTSAEVK